MFTDVYPCSKFRTSATYCPNGDNILVSSLDSTIALYEVNDFGFGSPTHAKPSAAGDDVQSVLAFRGHTNSVFTINSCLCERDDSCVVVSGSEDGKVVYTDLCFFIADTSIYNFIWSRYAFGTVTPQGTIHFCFNLWLAAKVSSANTSPGSPRCLLIFTFDRSCSVHRRLYDRRTTVCCQRKHVGRGEIVAMQLPAIVATS
jgi:WD40 repeat protein